MNAPSILWFRLDLRLADNPALNAAMKSGGATAVFWNRRCEPVVIARDAKVKESFLPARSMITLNSATGPMSPAHRGSRRICTVAKSVRGRSGTD